MSTTESTSPRATTTIHPSAIGSGICPDTANTGSEIKSESTRAQVGDIDYPEQRHAGAIGYGPNYHRGPSMGDKMMGATEVLKGKLTRNPELVEHGREKSSGILQKKEQEALQNESPFDKVEADQASTVAPEGTQHSQNQRDGSHAYKSKDIGQ